ncbi:unnamed protein product [marine sediment metagenome]|uniref:Uncharacterized protein n=1 Tax=marine sediment metagenome TaxID=412755 RepID=X0S9N0_9ZZZZ
MDSDDVNSIDDTVESQQVAEIVRQSFFDMLATRNWPHLSGLIQFEASGTPSQPTHLKIPPNVKEVNFIKYDKRIDADNPMLMQDVIYLDPYDFLTHTYQRDNTQDTVDTIDNGDGVKILILNNQAPQYWTSFDDVYVVMDSYNNVMDSTIQNDKMQVKAYSSPTWEASDDFVPDLPSEAFSNLVAEAKSNAFLVLKQMVNQKAEQTAKKQSSWLSRKAWVAHGGVKYATYGRRGRTTRKDPTFRQDDTY